MNGESNINVEVHVNKLKPCPLAKAQTQPESQRVHKDGEISLFDRQGK